MTRLEVLAPLRIEARHARRGARAANVSITGAGPRRARAFRAPGTGPIAVVGVCGALDPALAPGDIVVADRVVADEGAGGNIDIAVPIAPVLAAELRRAGLPGHVGALVSCDRLALGNRRAAWHEAGFIAADMETAWLLDHCRDRPVVVVRVVVDTPQHGLVSPSLLGRGVRALRVLERAMPTISSWAAAVTARQVTLAHPRGFCAGVERAVTIVERAIEKYGAPVYVRRQIVHNSHVVDDLASRGAIFVEELDEVPVGSRVVLAAHGVAPAVRGEAEARDLIAIDATCPLVAKVHSEVRRFAGRGDTVFLVGHPDHEEVQGTLGEAPEHIVVIEHPRDVALVQVRDPARVGYVTQTTLALDETREIVELLHERFPTIEGPSKQDICYATQNRQEAVRALAADCDLVLVVGSANSSNSNRLVEVARRAGCRAQLVEDDEHLSLSWLAGVERVGITAGASAPESMVQRVLGALRALGPIDERQQDGMAEDIRFSLPREVR
jgi:4-hydroxy-3-methylbut-2-enyl diphosphate reductase